MNWVYLVSAARQCTWCALLSNCGHMLYITGWDKLRDGLHGMGPSEGSVVSNAVLITKTWYYETSVLLSV